MMRVYAKTLLSIEEQIKLDSKWVAHKKDPNKARFVVNKQIEGKTYRVIYQMKRDSAESSWLVHNIIIDGVNLGVLFRDQFNAALNKYSQNLDKVIHFWDKNK